MNYEAEELTPMLKIMWDTTLKDIFPPGHPIARMVPTIRRYQDCTIYSERESVIVDKEPYTFFLMKTKTLYDVIPFGDSLGRYEFDARLLPGGSYPIECWMCELLIDGEPAWDRQKKTFHPVLNF